MTTPSKPRVLCVDDEPAVLRSLNNLLRDHFDVLSATNAHDGLALIRSRELDVVISDQHMPGMLGTEFLEHVKRVSPQTMRLLLSGQAAYADLLRSVNDCEVFRYILKPWNDQHLVDMVTYAAAVARTIPLGRAAIHSAESASEALADVNHKNGSVIETVLLVDEDATTEHQLRTVLGQGTLLLWARSPVEAVSLMNRHKVAVMVANTQRGDGATLKLIQAVKRSSPNIVAVVHAADCDSTTIGRLINEGQIFRFLSKSAGPTSIERAIRAALEKHRQLMVQPTAIARHALDISRLAASARSRHDPVDGVDARDSSWMTRPAKAPPAATRLLRQQRAGVRWLRRLFSLI